MSETTLNTTAVSELPLRSDVFDDVPIFSVITTVVLGLVIIAGNFVTLLAIKLSPSFRSAPDLYLASLAVADLLVGFTTFLKLILQFGFSQQTNFKMEGNTGKYVCLGSISFGTTAFMSSVSSLALLALDRCLSISYPLVYNSLAVKQRTRFVIIGAWFTCVVFGLLPLMFNRFSPHRPCSTFTQLQTWYVRYLSTGFILLGMTVSLLCYFKIGWVYHSYQRSISTSRGTSSREPSSSQRNSKAKDTSNDRYEISPTESRNDVMTSNPRKSENYCKYQYNKLLPDRRFRFNKYSFSKRHYFQRAFINSSHNTTIGTRASKNHFKNYSLMWSSHGVKHKDGTCDQTMGNKTGDSGKARICFCSDEPAYNDKFLDNSQVCHHSNEPQDYVSKGHTLRKVLAKSDLTAEHACGTMTFVERHEEYKCDGKLDPPPLTPDVTKRVQFKDQQGSRNTWDPIVTSTHIFRSSTRIFTTSEITLKSTCNKHRRNNDFTIALHPCSTDASRLRDKTKPLTRSNTLPSIVCSSERDESVKLYLPGKTQSCPMALGCDKWEDGKLANVLPENDGTLANILVGNNGTLPSKPWSCVDIYGKHFRSSDSFCSKHSQFDLISRQNNCCYRSSAQTSKKSQALSLIKQCAPARGGLNTPVTLPAPVGTGLNTPVPSFAPVGNGLITPVSSFAPIDNRMKKCLHEHSQTSGTHFPESTPYREQVSLPFLFKEALTNNTSPLSDVTKDVNVSSQTPVYQRQKLDKIPYDVSPKTQKSLDIHSLNPALTFLKTDSTDLHENALMRSEPRVNKQVLAKAMSHNSTRLIKMIFLTQVVFVLCVLPSMLVFLLNGLTYIPQWMMHAAAFLAFINSGVNVFIYVVYNVKYRKAILAALRCVY